MKFKLDYPPSLNRLWRHFHGRAILSREAREYKKVVQYQALEQRVTRQDGPLCVSLHLFRPAKRGDIDNATKALFDSLNGLAWNDDSQIVEMHVYRGDDKNYPRVEINVESRP